MPATGPCRPPSRSLYSGSTASRRLACSALRPSAASWCPPASGCSSTPRWPQYVGPLALADHWLAPAMAEASADVVVEMLERLGSTRVTARAGYLADRFGRPDVADRIAGLGRSPVAVPLLPGAASGNRDRRFNVVDPIGAGSRS
ncbi:MAG: hypothetical protein U0838_04750 [Chloroflexota bacterium]